MSTRNMGGRFLRVLCLALAGLIGASTAGAAHAQPKPSRCAQELTEAQGHYQNGAFGEAAWLARQCLEKEGAAIGEKELAYRLLTLARLRQGRRADARQAVIGLLLTAPAYEADPLADPPSYTQLVDETRQQMRADGRLPAEPSPPPRPWYERRGTWLAVGGGLVVAGLVAIFGGG